MGQHWWSELTEEEQKLIQRCMNDYGCPTAKIIFQPLYRVIIYLALSNGRPGYLGAKALALSLVPTLKNNNPNSRLVEVIHDMAKEAK